ncbi:hypothetical protein [Engelhardtia mirabilis]
MIEDSLDLDSATAASRGTARSWDYLLGARETGRLVAVEIHPVKAGNVTEILEKRRASERLLARELRASERVHAWVWIPSGRSDFGPFERDRLRLDQEGVRLVSRPASAARLGLNGVAPRPRRR